jgi:hypothetical protein
MLTRNPERPGLDGRAKYPGARPHKWIARDDAFVVPGYRLPGGMGYLLDPVSDRPRFPGSPGPAAAAPGAPFFPVAPSSEGQAARTGRVGQVRDRLWRGFTCGPRPALVPLFWYRGRPCARTCGRPKFVVYSTVVLLRFRPPSRSVPNPLRAPQASTFTPARTIFGGAAPAIP